MSSERSASRIDQEVGRRVRVRRLDIGMSQERLAEALGVTFQQVQKYEKGVNRISVGRLAAIAAAMKTPIAYFFDGLTEGVARPVDETVARSLATADGALMARLFAHIKTPRVRRRVIDVARALVEERA